MMKLTIGEKIKNLRRERELTQEDLAEVLCVSSQSVSRWENGSCYPDIELLPVLSEYFGITVDRLLGTDESVEGQRVNQYLEAFQQAISHGDVNGCIALARSGVAEFPTSYALLNKLMYALFLSGDSDGNDPAWKENAEKYDAEITALGERIMKYCPDVSIRLEATARLAFHHCEMGRTEQGRRVYETLPSAEWCREIHMTPCLAQDEKLVYARKLAELGKKFLFSGMYLLSREGVLSDEETLSVFEKRELLEDILFDGWRRTDTWGAANHHCKKAAVLLRLHRGDEAFSELREAARAAKEFDGRPETACFHCLLLGDQTVHKTDFETGDTRSLCEIMRDKWLEDADFNPVRHSCEFQEIVDSLD
jgi:transcriptional regulator with XRE-family HTH domain